jgi:PAS domain S-box-containing protein
MGQNLKSILEFRGKMTENKQILVVEDEVVTAMDIQRRLKNMGYNVPVVVSSGEEAIKKVKENNPDLVLMDINLIGEMDGIEASSKIHSFSNIPVIYLTAFSDDKTFERARITEPYSYTIKPIKERELHINIEIAFYRYRMEKELRDSRNWFHAALYSIGDAVIATDKEGIIQVFNPFAQALTGWKEEEALNRPLGTIFKIINGETGENVEDPRAKAIREGTFYGLAFNTILIGKDGWNTPVDIIGSSIKDEMNNIIGIIFTFITVSKHEIIH